jgi:mannose-1-phosphate guanylyltransferase
MAPNAIILAGGDGVRLRPLTRELVGDDRPKQFCPIVGPEPLLAQTRRRAALVVPPERTWLLLTRAHQRFYAPLVAGLPPGAAVIQPENRGTAPAILYALLRLAMAAPAGSVVLLPSDHHVSDDADFMAHVEAALDVVVQRPDLVVLLGIAAERPETQYGWIEPSDPICGPWRQDVYRVRRFVEKPSAAEARRLQAAGSLWNSFVIVGEVPALLAMVDEALPSLFDAFVTVRPTFGTSREVPAVERLYCGLPVTDFSRQVLSASPSQLAVLPVEGVEWDDLGDPDRVQTARARLRLRAA